MINGTVKLLRKTYYGYRNLTVDVFHLVLQLRFFEKNLFLRLVGILLLLLLLLFFGGVTLVHWTLDLCSDFRLIELTRG